MFSKLRHINIILISGCLLASCTSDAPDIPKDPQGSEIHFTTIGGTRAAIASDLRTEGSKFALFGDMKLVSDNSSDIVLHELFNNTDVTFKGDKWSYDNLQYWFPGFEYSFVAIYPAGASGMSDTEYLNSKLSFRYNLPDNYQAISDLMVATHRRLFDGLSESASPVHLNFVHIMSGIDFKVKNDNAADILRVTKIELKGIDRRGSFSIIPASLLTSGDRTVDYTSSWTDISNRGDLNAGLKVDIAENEVGSLFPETDALLVVPQPDNKGVIMVISYELWDDGKKFEEHTLTATTPIGGWKAGKTYTYSMVVSEITKEIELTVKVKDWHPEQNKGITVPAS